MGKFFVLCVLANVAACSKGGGALALPPGTYQAGLPVCVSTGASPAYPDGTHKAALFAFDGLTAHTLAVQAFTVTETFQDPTCRVVATHGIYENGAGVYGAMHGRHFTFAPAGCALTLVAAGTTYKASPAYGPQFQDSDDASEELPYAVTPGSGGAVVLTSVDSPDLDGLWSAYGCAKSDRVSQILKP